MPTIDVAAIPDDRLIATMGSVRRAQRDAIASRQLQVVAECENLLDELSAELNVRARCGRLQFATEPTEQGNQFVIPGCEKDRSRGPDQIDLF